jgi:hypothetical protein
MSILQDMSILHELCPSTRSEFLRNAVKEAAALPVLAANTPVPSRIAIKEIEQVDETRRLSSPAAQFVVDRGGCD